VDGDEAGRKALRLPEEEAALAVWWHTELELRQRRPDKPPDDQDHLYTGNTKALEDSAAKYPIKRVVCKSFQIAENYLDASHKSCSRVSYPHV